MLALKKQFCDTLTLSLSYLDFFEYNILEINMVLKK